MLDFLSIFVLFFLAIALRFVLEKNATFGTKKTLSSTFDELTVCTQKLSQYRENKFHVDL